VKPYPPTRRDDVVDLLHGVEVPDPYRWLEDVDAPEVQAWMTAQDDHARAVLDALPQRASIAARLQQLFYFDAVGAPEHHGGRYFWTRRHADKEKAIVYWKDGADGEPRVLFDPNTWSEDGSTSLGGFWPSHDGTRVAYAVKENNADEAVMYVVDVATGARTGDVIEGTKYSGASWTPAGDGFYYTWVPPVGGAVTIADRPGFAEVRFHRLGDDPARDAVVRERTGDPQSFLGGEVSYDGRWLLAAVSHGWSSTDVYFQDLRAATPAWQTLVEGVDATFGVTAWGDAFYVTTNHEAPRYRVMRVDPARPALADWKELVPEDAGATLEGAGVVGGHLALSYLRKACSELQIRTLDGGLVRHVELPGVGTATGLSGAPDEDTAYFGYSSFTEPSLVFKTSVTTGETTEWSRVTLPVDTSRMVTEQVTYASKDGTPVTMFLIRDRDAKPAPGGGHPTLLYGYGGFNVSLTPAFASSRAVWLERGGIVAIPNLRGGGEYGEDWHQAGMLDRKQNVFDDFLAAARWLIDQGWTTPAQLAIQGGSNGGLLVGAAMTQAPALFRAVICAVPLLDMVRYHRFGSGKTWIPEYGSADDAAQFATLYAYSPYHRVVAGTRYPAMLMLAADSDDRVDPMHARKFVAQVRAATAASPAEAPVLLRIERNAGHGGADLVKQAVAQTADTFAFLLEMLAPRRPTDP
jgi:prolyl oligopeptidase